MHLSDNEIFKYLKDNTMSNAHLEQCGECQLRLKNRSEFQAKLNQTYHLAEVEMRWDVLTDEFDKNFNNQKQQKMESKIRKLQIGLVSLAACFCLVVLIPLFTSNQPLSSIESELALVIDENHQLQRSLELSAPYGALQTVTVQTLRIKLQQIDSEIQLSYVEDLPKLKKLKLWEARKKVLINSIEKLNNDLSKSTGSI